MPMSSAGRAVNSNGCVTKPKECGIGLRSCFVPILSSSLTGSYVMATAEQREPYESRGSCTVLGEPGGESPPGHSTIASVCWRDRGGPGCGSAMATGRKLRRSFLSDRLELRLLLVAQRSIKVLERGAHQ